MTSSSRGEEGVLYPCIRALCHSEAHTDREFIGVTYPPTPPPPPPPPLSPPQAFAFFYRQEIKCKFPQPEITNLMLRKRTKRNRTAEKVVHRLSAGQSREASTFSFTFSAKNGFPSLRFVLYFPNFPSICGNNTIQTSGTTNLNK